VLLKPVTLDTMTAEEIRARTLKILEEVRYPMLATCDGDQPRVRPVAPVKYEGFTVYLATRTRFHKVAELAFNRRVELCYMAPRHDQVRITGTADRVSGDSLLRQVWDSNALLKEWLGSIDNPEFLLYRITPSEVRYMREWSLDYLSVQI
jgi:general stress protein 26